MIIYFVLGAIMGGVIGFLTAAILNATCCDVLEESKPIIENTLTMIQADIEDVAELDTVDMEEVKTIFAGYIERLQDEYR